MYFVTYNVLHFMAFVLPLCDPESLQEISILFPPLQYKLNMSSKPPDQQHTLRIFK